MALVMTTSCSDNGKMKALLEQIPENTEVVCVGNVKTILESARRLHRRLENQVAFLRA